MQDGSAAAAPLLRRATSTDRAEWSPLDPLMLDATRTPARDDGAQSEPLPSIPPTPEHAGPIDVRRRPPGTTGSRYFSQRGSTKALEPPQLDVIEFSLKHLSGRACKMSKRMLLQEINAHLTDDAASSTMRRVTAPDLRHLDVRHKLEQPRHAHLSASHPPLDRPRPQHAVATRHSPASTASTWASPSWRGARRS